MGKPKILYHGDRKRLEILEPSQAVGLGDDTDSHNAVYAVAVKEWAIPFAMTFVPSGEDAVFSVVTESHPPHILLKNAFVRWDKVGFLYTLPSDSFERVDERQWVSYSPVIPLRIEQIDPRDYREWIDAEKE